MLHIFPAYSPVAFQTPGSIRSAKTSTCWLRTDTRRFIGANLPPENLTASAITHRLIRHSSPTIAHPVPPPVAVPPHRGTGRQDRAR